MPTRALVSTSTAISAKANCELLAQAHTNLRAITQADFEEAVKETAPSSEEYSHTMEDLRAWNSKYGEGQKDRGYQNSKLSYFI